MKRSVVNQAYRDALACFDRHHWALPPRPRWDITDFGLGDFDRNGLTLVNLASEPEYCEKLMFARRNQATPCHTHARKKEDIICRTGELTLRLWPGKPAPGAALPPTFVARIDGEPAEIPTGAAIVLAAGSRITLVPGVWHTFWPAGAECIIGEVSTANDDVGDNFFLDPGAGRFPGIEEDEPASVRLLCD
ncbi:MAG TPA: D-lyxose/D-mannose family sugar isomerase [Opitutaceae bacterium]|nr:D-lyxose/D-mannose family sugar isomerase [Opitutaceae bacterium]